MSNIKKLMMSAAGGGGLDVDEVFSTYLYEGNGGSQTITNGIDLDGEGGLVWGKTRTAGTNHYLYDTERGIYNLLASSSTGSEFNITDRGVSAFNADGFAIKGAFDQFNSTSEDFVSWTFRKAPKFFDVVTYTGDSTSNRQIAHNLGSTPGMVIVKNTARSSNWATLHKDAGLMFLNSNGAAYSDADTGTQFGDDTNRVNPTSTHFTVASSTNTNQYGETHVAYLFAHNDGDGGFGPDGDQDIIKCGSYTGNGSADGPEIDLGFEPQWLLTKAASSTSDWHIWDAMRGVPTGGDDARLTPNSGEAEFQNFDAMSFLPTGFKLTISSSRTNASGVNYIYMAIRRGSLFPPESATDVFALDYSGNASSTAPWFTSGFPVDLGIHRTFTSANNFLVTSRLIQGKYLRTNGTNAETNITGAKFDFMNGFYDLALSTSTDTIGWMWKRAPGYFDVVAYTGNSLAGHAVSHNLGVAPEMMWIKRRNNTTLWCVYHHGIDVNGDGSPETDVMFLNATSQASDNSGMWNDTAPTDTHFTLGNYTGVNNGSGTYIAYLFASLPGISKVGSYTGTGSTPLNIDCGFTSGARFVLIKRTDQAFGWFVWDTEGGITASYDPLLELNTTAAELSTSNVLNPYSPGFQIIDNYTGVNENGGSYIFYAIA